MSRKLKLFISYSHLDKEYIEDFIKSTSMLKANGLIENWYDRKILAGTDYQEDIDNNLADADIICLFTSSNFLSSQACLKEIDDSISLYDKKGISVIPIILKKCVWLDNKKLSALKAIPEDGTAVDEFQTKDSAWLDIYSELKRVIENEIYIKSLSFSREHLDFLQDAELLTKSHSSKEIIYLNDIFMFPELNKYDYLKEFEKKISSKNLIDNFLSEQRFVLAGENQSGKTTLCKLIIEKVRSLSLVPVYLSADSNKFKGNIDSIINNNISMQYDEIDFNKINKNRIVVIVDDFHCCMNKEKYIEELQKYKNHIIVVDDIFNLNFKNESLVLDYNHYKIRELRPSQINQLIENWNSLNNSSSGRLFHDNEIYKELDKKSELVNATLGKIIGNGIMPSYPFFVLSIISTHDSFYAPLDQEITSQGYCYQAFIYVYLRKQNVKNDEIDIYINFLTELSFFLFSNDNNELSIDEYNDFLSEYLEKFNLPISEEKIVANLDSARLLYIDSLGNVSFQYKYIYYFFVAKYLAENTNKEKDIIDKIVANLHVDEYSYIAIFISHHTKNDAVLDEIILNASSLFEKFKPTTLSKDELSFFDNQSDIIADAVLPPANNNPEAERAKRLAQQDKHESKRTESNRESNKDTSQDKENIALEVRRSIKTVEVMGRIIKNRAGSLEKPRLEFVFEEAMNVHLRILDSFFEVIKNEEEQEVIVNFIEEVLNDFIKTKGRKPNDEKLRQLSKVLFWNLNFHVVYNFIMKLVHSLGSNKLMPIIEKVCDERDTPATFLVKHGIYMWFNKNLKVENIANRIDEDGFSKISKKIIEYMIVNHCLMHHINFKDKQIIEHRLGISTKRLLLEEIKETE